jgi:hypothetical protein
MEKHRIEAFLDTLARKMIADELRVFYGSIEGNNPQLIFDVLSNLDRQTNLSHDADTKFHARN